MIVLVYPNFKHRITDMVLLPWLLAKVSVPRLLAHLRSNSRPDQIPRNAECIV